MEQDHHFFMRAAIRLAKQAEALGEIPIGAVVVHEGIIIGSGYNRRETDKNPLGHAELMAISEASQYLKAWRLSNCQLYVTLEPCPMCAGALLQARVDQVIYATEDPKSGYAGSLYNLLQDDRLNHQTRIISGIYREECRDLLRSFFQQLRSRKKANHCAGRD